MKYIVIILVLIGLKNCENDKQQPSIKKLIEGDWQIKTVQNTSAEQLSTTKFRFNSSDKTISATVGCNMHNCAIDTITENKIQFNNCISTEMFCNNLNDYEIKLKQALNTITTYTFNENTLVFKNKSNQIVLVLKK